MRVITYRFSARDLLRVRFASSPLIEVFSSFDALRRPEAHPEHEPWVRWANPRLADVDLSLMEIANPGRVGYRPDFVNPPPDRPRTTLERELGRVLRTPRARVRRELAWAHEGGAIPRLDLRALAAQVTAYFERALAPYWPRIEAAFEAEFSLRGRRLAHEGAAAAFADLHPAVRFADDSLLIDRAYDADVELQGRGLLLVASVFVAPEVWAMTDAPWQPSVIYAPPGVGQLWAPPDGLKTCFTFLLVSISSMAFTPGKSESSLPHPSHRTFSLRFSIAGSAFCHSALLPGALKAPM